MKIGILGRNGFIGHALAKAFEGHELSPYLKKDLDIVYFFGSPSSNIIFDNNLQYSLMETINGFLGTIQFCKDNDIRLVYPSSATVYNKNTAYARCKAILEEIHMAYDGNVLGLRIFAGYGEGEWIKKEYASVIYQWCVQMKHGIRPIIFGDGTQTRDFIYIDDIVDTIVSLKEETGIVDVGTGINTSFNDVVRMINNQLIKSIQPIYVNKPPHYVEETVCKNPIKAKVSLEEGIGRICRSFLS
jgi:nucleoside-diphosphate-sugar epimerase